MTEREPQTKTETTHPKHFSYPDRHPVNIGTSWREVDRQKYQPPYFVSKQVLENPVWADFEDHKKVKRNIFLSYEGLIQADFFGRPLNPRGPTGIEGRGVLGGWGANFAADPIVTRINSQGFLELIVIKRKDCGMWALPGGMVDKGERVTATLRRELGEEASAYLDFEKASLIYQGYVDDPRNTDNAWMETDAYHLHLTNEEASGVLLKANDDAKEAKWMTCNSDAINNLYANHPYLVRQTIKFFEKSQNQTVISDGRVVDNKA